MTQNQQTQDIFAPVFANIDTGTAVVADDISLLEVKDLYDTAYSAKEQDERIFKALLAEAVKMDLAYRRQLTKKVAYKDPKQKNTFKQACQGVVSAQHVA